MAQYKKGRMHPSEMPKANHSGNAEHSAFSAAHVVDAKGPSDKGNKRPYSKAKLQVERGKRS